MEFQSSKIKYNDEKWIRKFSKSKIKKCLNLDLNKTIQLITELAVYLFQGVETGGYSGVWESWI